MVEKEINARVKSAEHNPACPVSGDYEGLAVKHWGLQKRAVTIVVDGQGLVVFLAYGVLSPRQQGDIFLMLDVQQRSPDNNLDQNSKSEPQA
jgi:predicted transcriptional regulator